KTTRIWSTSRRQWQTYPMPLSFINVGDDGARRDAGIRFGVVNGISFIAIKNETEEKGGTYGWLGERDDWIGTLSVPTMTSRDGVDRGVRLRHIDPDDDAYNVLVSNGTENA